MAPTRTSVGAAGGELAFTVTAGSGCTWTATSQANWLTVTAGAEGSGNGTVRVGADANATTSGRSGTVQIAGRAITVTQDGLPVVTVEGVVSNASGNCPSRTFMVADTTVVTGSGTAFTGGRCQDARNGARVHVTGVQQLNGTVTATTVQIQKQAKG